MGESVRSVTELIKKQEVPCLSGSRHSRRSRSGSTEAEHRRVPYCTALRMKKVNNGSVLTLRPLATSGSGPVIGSEPYRYEVIGLPTGRGAMLARLSGVWKILEIEAGKTSAWTGSFVTAHDALTSLESDVGTSN